jgi:ADP-ribosylglycohydrolase
MRTPNWHSDTYVEEYHRAFFDNLAQGHKPENCGIKDIHIGGLTPVPFLMAAFEALRERDRSKDAELVESHLALTHRGEAVAKSGRALVKILQAVASGQSLREAIAAHATDFVSAPALDTWSNLEDRSVVGRHLTTACYLPESFTASLYLAWKYHDDFSAGVLANARCGGDNAHRGTAVGALLGAANGVPRRWLSGLRSSIVKEMEAH